MRVLNFKDEEVYTYFKKSEILLQKHYDTKSNPNVIFILKIRLNYF